jgi:hypothetical protein
MHFKYLVPKQWFFVVVRCVDHHSAPHCLCQAIRFEELAAIQDDRRKRQSLEKQSIQPVIMATKDSKV